MLLPVVQGSVGGFVVAVGTTTNFNILTAATAAGFTNGSGQSLIVNVSGVVTGAPAMRTGAIDGSNVTINILSGGRIDGDTGTTGTSRTCSVSGLCATADGTAGGVGGDALFWETVNSKKNTVNVRSGGFLRGGRGGGGGGGAGGRQAATFTDAGVTTCDGNAYCGANGAAGAAGAFGAAGAAGAAGSYPTGSGDGDGFSDSCRTGNFHCAPGNGGAGGAGGFALRKNSRTVAVNNSGTLAGSTS